jgi:hypothetical protein
MARTRSTSSVVLASILLLTFLFSVGAVQAQTTAFTYQGKLTDAGNPANGNYDLQFKLFDTVTVGTGAQQGATLVRNPVAASAGVFTVTLDFGANVFGGADRYLEIGVRPAGSANPYTILAPRQPVTATPYAIQTLNAQQLGGLPANRYVTTNASGNVGIGTTTPTSKLEIAAQDGLAITGFQPFITLRDTNASGARGILASGNGDFGFYPNSFIGGSPAVVIKSGTGNVGIGTSNPSARLTVSGAGAFNASGAARFDLRNTSLGDGYLQNVTDNGAWQIATINGAATRMLIDSSGTVSTFGHITQARDKGGLVKAMIYVDPFLPAAQYIVRCYNGITNSSTGNCGFSMVRDSEGQYRINFGFQTNDRFFSLTLGFTTVTGAVNPSATNEISVAVTKSQLNESEDSRFYVIVY